MIDAQTRTPDIWLLDLQRGTETRLTFDAAGDRAPLWSPDGSEIIFASDRTGVWDLYRKSVNGAKPEEPIGATPGDEFPYQWSNDGRYVVSHVPNPQTNWDIWVTPVAEPSKARPFLQTPFNEVQGALSPDGQWMAYASDETGIFEVYVQSFPVARKKWQVSVRGGSEPKWRSDGRELFYIAPQHKLMSVEIRQDSTFQAGVPRELFRMAIPDLASSFPSNYEVVGQGQRFLVNTLVPNALSSPISVVLNWTAELKH